MSKACLIATFVVCVMLQACTASRVLIMRPDPDSRWKGRNRISRVHLKAQGGAMMALGNSTIKRLARRARYSGRIEQLVEELDRDDDLVVDATTSRLQYVCTALIPSEEDEQQIRTQSEIASGVLPTAPDPTITLATVFKLHSRPGASKVIYLNYAGGITTGTKWNAGASSTIITPAYDMDGNPSNFNPAELQAIMSMWRSVSEDYSPFDVDVTTEDPGPAALVGRGVKVNIGGHWSDWYGATAGGVSYKGTFGALDSPVFVFSWSLSSGLARFTQEATSHEIGHSLGLSHDGVQSGGVTTSAYFGGQGDWAPIMGTSYYKTYTQFDKGEYPGSNNQQDDFAVISKFLPLIKQEHGTDTATATNMPRIVSSPTATVARSAGVLTDPAVSEFMGFQAQAGPASLNIATLAGRSNLLLQATLYAPSGSIVWSASGPGAQMTTRNLPATGTYYLRIASAGSGAFATNGFSNYGSRGQWEANATFVPCAVNCGTPLPPMLEVPPSTAPNQNPGNAPVAKVTSIGLTRVKTSDPAISQCSATVMLKDAAGKAISTSRLTVAWFAQYGGANMQQLPSQTTTTTSLGSASFRSANILAADGYGCNVTPTVLEGYTLDTSLYPTGRSFAFVTPSPSPASAARTATSNPLRGFADPPAPPSPIQEDPSLSPDTLTPSLSLDTLPPSPSLDVTDVRSVPGPNPTPLSPLSEVAEPQSASHVAPSEVAPTLNPSPFDPTSLRSPLPEVPLAVPTSSTQPNDIATTNPLAQLGLQPSPSLEVPTPSPVPELLTPTPIP